MIEKYESQQARSENSTGAALADLRTALQDRLSSGLDVRCSNRTPAGYPQKGVL